jgi:hypothetical protein
MVDIHTHFLFLNQHIYTVKFSFVETNLCTKLREFEEKKTNTVSEDE